MAIDLTSIIGENVGAAFKDIVGAFKADPTVQAQVQAQLAEAQIALQSKLIDEITGQISVNQAEAASNNLFVSGWRPFAGWICCTGLLIPALVYLGQCITMLVHGQYVLPSPNTTDLLGTLGGLLGLGTLRTIDKTQGVGNGT